MNSIVLILLLVCGEPVAMTGWAAPLGVGGFFGTIRYVEGDPELNMQVQMMLAHPATQKLSYEMVEPERCR